MQSLQAPAPPVAKRPAVHTVHYDNCYKYWSSLGNNGELVKRVLDTREWWKDTPVHNSGFNFKWVCVSQAIKFDRLQTGNKPAQSQIKQLVNFFEGHREISTKTGLIKNMKIFCETNKLQLFDITPLTFILDLNDEGCEFQLGKFASFFLKNHPNKNGTGSLTSQQNAGAPLNAGGATTSISAAAGTATTNAPKEGAQNAKKAIFELKKRLRPIMSSVVSEKSQKTNPYSKPKMYNTFTSKAEKYLWLLKPTGLNRGRGIQIFSDLETFEKYLFDFVTDRPEPQSTVNSPQLQQQQTQQQSQNASSSPGKPKDKKQHANSASESTAAEENAAATKHYSPQNSSEEDNGVPSSAAHKGAGIYNPIIKSYSFVIQKYIEQPLLIENRKFDIRVWVLVTHTMDVYFFKRGYIRTSCEVYDIDSTDLYVHLTNNAVQRYAQNYGEYEQGNLITFEMFDAIMRERGLADKCDFFGRVMPTMKEYCWMNMQSVKKKLNPEERRHCFQIFGYDYIIDADYKVWLIECNCNPCLEETAPYLQMLIPRMVDDAFKLTVDQVFPRKNPQATKTIYQSTYERQLKELEEANRGSLAAAAVIGSTQAQADDTPQAAEAQPVIIREEEEDNIETPKKASASDDEQFESINSVTNQQNPCSNNTNTQTDNNNQPRDNSPLKRDAKNAAKPVSNERSPNIKHTSPPTTQQPGGSRGAQRSGTVNKQHFPVEGFSDEENMWEMLGSLTAKTTAHLYTNKKPTPTSNTTASAQNSANNLQKKEVQMQMSQPPPQSKDKQ